MKKYKTVLKLFSLLPTPILLFISSALPLYLSNQLELNYQWAVLLPFLYAAVSLFIIGLVLLQFKPSHLSSALIWLYYLSGPALLVFSLLREISSLQIESPVSIAIFLTVFIGCLIVFARKFDHNKITALMASFGLLLLLQISLSLASNMHFGAEDKAVVREGYKQKTVNKQLPNIYHLVLDEYQSDFFDMQRSEPLEQALNGFNYYPNASALYNLTTWSIPSIFLGEEYQFPETKLSYQSRAFNGEQSFLASLKKVGYSTVAITRKLYPFNLKLFDQTLIHSQNSGQLVVDNSDVFIDLWIYRVLPNMASKKLAESNIFLDLATYENLENRTFLADSAPQESMISYLNYLSREQYLPAHGRYTYIHLLLPKGPYVYTAECGETNKSSMQIQSQCATNLLLKLITELKRLGRYEQSLIIVNSDHGSTYRKKDEQWVKSDEGRSHRSLLLIKPANTDSSDLFRRVESDVSIIDIASGIKQFALSQSGTGISPPWWRLDQKQQPDQSERYFYKVSTSKQAMGKFLINADQQLEFQEKIKFNSSVSANDADTKPSVFPVNTVIEAEEGLLSAATEIGKTLPDTRGSFVTFGTKSYRFELLEEAQVELQIRAISPNGNSNSTFLRINDGLPLNWGLLKSKSWKWHKYKTSWKLKKGVHTITLEYREPIYIDQLELITTPSGSEMTVLN